MYKNISRMSQDIRVSVLHPLSEPFRLSACNF